MPKISVIMPVYNEEMFLKETLDSVIDQTIKDIEIICVDDGSTDNSLTILREYAKQDNRVLVLHQDNSGAGVARNLGMTKATGEYIAFLDSDDLYEPVMLEEMYCAAKKEDLDVIVCRVNSFDTKTRQIKETPWTVNTKWLPQFEPFSGLDVTKHFFGIFVWWPWDKLFKRSFVQELGIEFQNLRTSNDLFFVAATTLKAGRISHIDRILAHHRVGVKSSLSVTRENSWPCFYHALTQLKKYLKEQKLFERFEADFVNYALHFSLWHLNTIHGYTYCLLYNALKNKWFEELGILGRTEDYFYNKGEFQQLKDILEMDLDSYLCKKAILPEQGFPKDTNGYKGLSFYLSFKDFLKKEGCFDIFERYFMNAALFDMMHALKNAETDSAYRDILTEVKYYVEEKLHFLDKPAAYYYDVDWFKEYLNRVRKKPDNTGITEKPKVTVVIPSLNSRPYIRECIESAIEQTLKEIEILCIDAGSTDGTAEVLQEYAELDHRIRIIRSDKKSYGHQMNLGIKAAKGEFLAVLESDDYIIPEMYEELYQIAKENRVEIVKADFEIFAGEKEKHVFIGRKIAKKDEQYNKVLDPSENLDLFKNENIPWSGLYKTDFLRGNVILLNESPGASFQDNGLWFQCMCQAHRLYYVNKSYYRLRRDNPESSIYSKDKVYCMCDEYDFIRNILRKDKNIERKFAPLIAYYRYINCSWRLGFITEEFKVGFLQRVAADFKRIEKDNELDASLFTKQQWVRLHKIMQDPVEYYYSESALNYEFIRVLPPERYPQILKRWFKAETGKTLDLDNPKTFNEKIQWLKLYDNTPLRTRLADKYRVREWVREKIGEEYLIPLLGIWDRFEDIDFDKFPQRFVLKANHGCGWNIIVKNKDKFDLGAAKEKFEEWMKVNYAARVGLELQYADIVPKIIAEEYIDEADGDIYDYRFFCFNGTPRYVWVDAGSGTTNHKRSIFDLKWNLQDMRVNYPQIEPVPPVPDNFEQMLQLARELSTGFIFVRIDFYSVKGNVLFGEMTFTPQSGKGKWYPEKQNLVYGELIKLPSNQKTPLPGNSLADKGVLPMPAKFVLPKTEMQSLKETIKKKDTRMRALANENAKLRKNIKKIIESKAFKIGEKIAWPVRKVRNLINN